MSKYKVGSNQYRKTIKDNFKPKMALLCFSIIMVGFYDLNITFNPSQSAASESVVINTTQKANPAESVRVVEQVSTPAATLKPLTREEKLKAFLEKKNSPLSEYADYIVKVSDQYDISWTLIVSIAGKESSFGNHIKPNSFNAWGVMQWDEKGKRSIRSFTSWKDGILFEAKLLSNSYRANMNKAIQEKYCPSFECSDTWVLHVTEFQKEINN